MENQPNVVETRSVTPPVPVQTAPKPKGKGGLIALCVILALLIVGLLVYIAYEKDYVQFPWMSKTDTSTDMPGDETEEKKADKTEVVKTSEVYTGKNIKATIPMGWSIVEYYNGDGSEYLSDGPAYTGLTGMKIFNASNTELFHISGVNGIGFAGCSEYYAFADDSPSYRAGAQSTAEEMGDTMHINDFSKTPYSEFEWLGKTTRRIDSKLYFDSVKGNNYFETPCFNMVVTLEGLYFSDEDSPQYQYEAYFYGFKSGITNTELAQIDEILESMTLVK